MKNNHKSNFIKRIGAQIRRLQTRIFIAGVSPNLLNVAVEDASKYFF